MPRPPYTTAVQQLRGICDLDLTTLQAKGRRSWGGSGVERSKHRVCGGAGVSCSICIMHRHVSGFAWKARRLLALLARSGGRHGLVSLALGDSAWIAGFSQLLFAGGCWRQELRTLGHHWCLWLADWLGYCVAVRYSSGDSPVISDLAAKHCLTQRTPRCHRQIDSGCTSLSQAMLNCLCVAQRASPTESRCESKRTICCGSTTPPEAVSHRLTSTAHASTFFWISAHMPARSKLGHHEQHLGCSHAINVLDFKLQHVRNLQGHRQIAAPSRFALGERK